MANKVKERICLHCRHCVEGTSIFDGLPVLLCYDVAGRQGVELIVDEEDTCKNFLSCHN